MIKYIEDDKELKRKQRFLTIVGSEIIAPLAQLDMDLSWFSDYVLSSKLKEAHIKVIEAYEIVMEVKEEFESVNNINDR